MPFQLPTATEKADFVLKQFDRIAYGYDLGNDVISFGMHRSWKARAVYELCHGGGDRFLDVCCGTGDLALTIQRYLKRYLKNSHTVTGIDFSPKMLAVAKRRARPEEHSESYPITDENGQNNNNNNIEWVCGDAQNLPFADDTFDGAIISFGLRNLTSLEKGISEMARVVKPKGRVVNLDLGHSTVPVFAQLFSFYFRHVVPVVGAILQKDRSAYTYLPASLATYPTPDGIAEIFAKAGLTNVRYIPLALGSVALHVASVPNKSVESKNL